MNDLRDEQQQAPEVNDEHIAVIGLAGRYPKSEDINAFWDNLKNGVDCLQSVTDEELDELGISPELYNKSAFVRRGTRLPYADCFDAHFFGFTPREAEMMDPQNRVFIETCYNALENAGYDPLRTEVPVGVFAGSNPNDYASLLGVANPADSLGAFDQLIGSDKDFLATRVAHRLNLKGPALTLQTACSTSLVAVHMAVQSLLSFESSICLAGGVTVNLRQGVGYFYQEGMILSSEGKCRAFDVNASGTTLGQGCGVAVLKRLCEALEDGDHIYAVIRGSAVNNDGADKLSFTAPSETGQAEVISVAHELAGVESDTIGYVEAHGTGTKLGDPIEVAGLTRAFAAGTSRTGYCAIGSAKTNFGHTDAAAGITGFLKAVLCLHNKKLVPSLHYEKASPDIGLDSTPFYVNTKLCDWPSDNFPRRAGVSAFGIGGTNAHVILEEAPVINLPEIKNQTQLLPLTAKSPEARDQIVSDLKKYLLSNEAIAPRDISYTLRHGRPEFAYRAAMLHTSESTREPIVVSGNANGKKRNLIWLYSGQGAQYPGMANALYGRNTTFTEAMDFCAELFEPLLKQDLRQVIFEEYGQSAAEALRQTNVTQPALFAIEYALAKMLQEWGLSPDAVIGHSIGEFAAGVQAGIFSIDDAVKLVYERGRLMQSMPTGSMLSVSIESAEVEKLLPDDLSLAAANCQGQSVVSGPVDSVEAFRQVLESNGADCVLLQTSHAFHSSMMISAAEQFEAVLSTVELSCPTLPMVSNITGQWISDKEAVSPSFWASQMTSAVQFSKCISVSTELANSSYLEVGPGRILVNLVTRNTNIDAQESLITHLLPHPSSDENAQDSALKAIGKIWCVGHKVDWDKINGVTRGMRTPLPGYPFTRTKHWAPSRKHVLSLPRFGEQDESIAAAVDRNPTDRWLYTPSWKRISTLPQRSRDESHVCVVFALESEAGNALTGCISASRPTVVVTPGDRYRELVGAKKYTVDPSMDDDIDKVFAKLLSLGFIVNHIIHAWLADDRAEDSSSLAIDDSLAMGVLAGHACGRIAGTIAKNTNVIIDFLTCGAQHVLGHETMRPEASALLGPAKVIPLEYPEVRCRHIDIECGSQAFKAMPELLRVLDSQISDANVLAIRGTSLWQYRVENVATNCVPSKTLKKNGCYMIVGGLGGVGLSLCQYLVDHFDAKVVLTGRSGRPSRSADLSDELARRLNLLEHLEKKAAGLLVLAADVTDEASMRAAVCKAELEFGVIDGVIVAAGVADYGGAIHRRTRKQAVDTIASKVHGSQILARIFKSKKPDFLFYSSSIASMLYHNRFGQVGYVTANSYVEAFAVKARQDGLNALTVAWDDWKEIGMSVRAAVDFSNTYGSKVNLVDEVHSFTPEEGVEIFKRAIECGEPVLYVSTTDLNLRMQRDVDVISPFLEQALAQSEDNHSDLHLDQSISSLLNAVWSDLLGYDSFDEFDDFFELGGDSLQAARMADRLSRTLSLEVSLNAVFDTPKFGGLVKELERLTSKVSLSEKRSALTGMLPLGPAQVRFLSRDNPNPNHFNISVLLKAVSVIEIEKLQMCIDMLIEQHDSLRFRLRNEGEDIYQECLPMSSAKVVVETYTLRGNDVASLEAVANNIQSKLNLWQGPVFRVALIERPDGSQRLLLVVHHMVSDRISLFLLLDGLNQLYQSLLLNEVPKLASRTADYASWISGLTAFTAAHAPVVEKWRAFDWCLVSALPVKCAFDRSLNTNESGADLMVRLTSESITALQRNGEGRIDEIVLVALAEAISEWTESGAAFIETLGHGRRLLPEVDVSRTCGFFLAYIPLFVTVEPDQSLPSRVRRLREIMVEAWTFDMIKNQFATKEVRDEFSALPRAQVLFNFVGREIVAEKNAFFRAVDEPLGEESDRNGLRDHLIAIRAEVSDEQNLEMTFVYSTSFHEKKEIDQLSSRVLELLSSWA